MPTGHYRFRRSLGNVSSNFRGARPDTYPRFTGLLDTYGGAAAAYSLRALSTGWIAGDVVEVRRSSDSTTQSFTASQINGGEMLNFVNSGTTHLYNSARYFNGVNTQVALNSIVTMTGDFSIYLDFTYSPTVTSQTYISDDTSNNRFGYSQTSSKFFISINGSTALFDASVGISAKNSAVVTRSGADVTITVNGNSDTQTVNLDNLPIKAIGRQSGVNFVKGSIFSLNLNNQAAYTGLGTSVTAWQDTIGSNNGTETNGAAYTGQPFDGFVSTWYDQSGNGNDATQATTTSQPKIVDGGSLVTGGLEFDGADDSLEASFAYQNGSIASVVNASVASAPSKYIYNGSTSAAGIHLLGSRSAGQNMIFQGAAISGGTLADTKGLWFGNFGAIDSLYINGLIVASGSAGTNAFTSNAMSIASYGSWDGTINELIFWSSSHLANRAAIETNINAFYSIY